MDLTPESKSILDIFAVEGGYGYKIPIYQRNYSWKEDNIEELFNDIKDQQKGYYIGNLLVTLSENSGKVYDVVDGQQRLSTIAMFFLGIYEKLTSLRFDPENDDLLEDINEKKSKIKDKLIIGSDKKLRIELLGIDNEIFEELSVVLNGQEPEKRYKNRVFGKRYEYIKDLIDSEFENFEQLNEFYEKLNSAELLQIKVNNLTDAFSVFTSFNATGVPLTLIDLLKSYYLKQANKINISDEDAIEKWNTLIDIFNNSNDEPNSNLITQFLQNNYDVYEGKSSSSITKNEALKKYERLFDLNGEQYINKLIENAKIYSAINPDSKLKTHKDIELPKNIEYQIERISKLDATQSYPILLFSAKEYLMENITGETLNDIFEYVVKYFVRRNIVIKPKSSNIRGKVISAIRELQTKAYNMDAVALEVISTKLNEIAATDEEFRASLNKPIYNYASRTARIMLIDLERQNGSYFDGKQNTDSLDEKYDNNNYRWTIEHIMPKTSNLTPYWEKMLGNEDKTDLERKAIQEEYVHKIGNLTLTGYNSEMSIHSFDDKKNYTEENSGNNTGLKTSLFLNESLAELDENFEKKNTWDLKDIDRRTSYLADKIVELYKLK